MAYEVGYVDNSVKLAHYAFLDKIRDLAVIQAVYRTGLYDYCALRLS